jgi:ribonuclease HII
MPDFAFERRCEGVVCGIDEVGRGPLAGPVFAAAVVLDRQKLPRRLRAGIDDSKKLDHETRADYAAALRRVAIFAIGAASVAEIDRFNILQASFLAMRRALTALPIKPDMALVDGNRAPALPCRVETIIGGDSLSLSIAAASILAKVARDELMRRLAARYDGYGWHTNMGYATEEHRAAIVARGLTPHHRLSFQPQRDLFGFDSNTAP